MKRFWLAVASSFLLSAFFVLPSYATVNDFNISNFEINYYLSQTNEGNSKLETVEKITTQFPYIDQNHGIERSLPLVYDGHKTNLKINSIKDISGSNYNYETRVEGDSLIIKIGDSKKYLYGENLFVIDYSQSNVTKLFTNTNSDEFYWDTNGTGWLVPIDNLSVSLHLDESLAQKLNGDLACYIGQNNSTNKCEINNSNGIMSTNSKGLLSGDNVTIAVGFESGTFTKYNETFLDLVTRYMAIVSMIVGTSIMVIVFIIRLIKGRNHPGKGIIIPEYLPPKNADLALSAIIKNKRSTWMAATFVDLAIKHKIKIIESQSGIFKKTRYNLELIDNENLSDYEAKIINAIFGEAAKVGDSYEIKNSAANYKTMTNLIKIMNEAYKIAKNEGYYQKKYRLRIFIVIVSVLIGLQNLLLMIFADYLTYWYESLPFFAGIIVVIGLTIAFTILPLSKKGREFFDYLEGLDMYIKIGEQERLKYLQSPTGADKKPVLNSGDDKKIVVLYERILPYAILFKREKEWTKVLGEYYEVNKTSPDWYVGRNGFNAIIFSSAISNFSNVTAKNVYAANSNSNFGGSGGGGFSGGGGGGGGGGGW